MNMQEEVNSSKLDYKLSGSNTKNLLKAAEKRIAIHNLED